MNPQLSYDAIGEVTATYHAPDPVTPGRVVKLSAAGQVAPCAAGERFCGLVRSARGDYAAVQTAGFARVPCTDETVTAGYALLTADGAGGVKKAASADQGREYLVVLTGTDTVTIQM